MSELPRAALDELPAVVDGSTFLEGWGASGDDVTAVRPDESYPVRAATTFGVEEHGAPHRRWRRSPTGSRPAWAR